MRVVIVRRDRLNVPDGINIFIFALADALMEMGHEVEVVTSFPGKEEETRGFFSFAHFPRLHWLGERQELRLWQMLWLWATRGRALVKALRPDMTIVNGAVPFKLAGTSFYVSHDMEPRMGGKRWLLKAFKRVSYGRADCVVATTVDIRDALAVELGVKPESIRVLPTCFRLDQYRGRPWEEREDAVLHIGTPKYKRPLTSMEALLKQTGAKKLYVTGKVFPDVQEAVAGLAAAERGRIELLGFVSQEDLLELLGKVKVVSVPSVYDFPVASPSVIEALASGTPVVSTSSISKDVLQDGVNGLVRESEAEAFAEGFERLVTDRACWERLSAGALATSGRFAADRVAAGYCEAWEALRQE